MLGIKNYTKNTDMGNSPRILAALISDIGKTAIGMDMGGQSPRMAKSDKGYGSMANSMDMLKSRKMVRPYKAYIKTMSLFKRWTKTYRI